MNENHIRIINSDYWDTFGNQLLDFLDIPPNIKILDVGTGGGTILIRAAKKVLPNGTAIGIDNWSDAIRRARINIEQSKLKNARVVKMDANKLEFADNTFDIVTSGFIGFCGIYDFEKFEMKPGKSNSIIRETHRVLKPGGKVGFNTWNLQEDLGIIQIMVEDNTVHPGYSKENEKGFRILMEDAGYQNITMHTLVYHRYFESIEKWAEAYQWLVSHFDLNHLATYKSVFKPYFSKELGKYDFKKCVIYALGEKG